MNKFVYELIIYGSKLSFHLSISLMASQGVIQSGGADEKAIKDLNRPISESASESLENGDAEKLDPEYGSYKDHIFSNPQVAEHWREVYEKAHYEGRHRFDPTFTWSAEEEKKVRRKVSLLNNLFQARKGANWY